MFSNFVIEVDAIINQGYETTDSIKQAAGFAVHE
jgi:hypothetical protein